MDAEVRPNTYSREQLQGILEEVAVVDDELLSLKSDYMHKCKGPRAQKREIIKSAKEAGLPMKALRELLDSDHIRRRKERRLDQLEADERADYDAMEEALGDYGSTPLGQSALQRAKQHNEQVLDGLA